MTTTARKAVAGRAGRRTIVAGVGALLAIGGVAIGHVALGSTSAPPAAGNAAAATAVVERTNLKETIPVTGSIGFAALGAGGTHPASIVQPAGTPPSALAQEQASVTGARQTLVADQQAAEDANAAGTQSVTQAQRSLSTADAALSADTATTQNDTAILEADEQREVHDCEASGNSSPSSACSADERQVASDQKTVTADQGEVTADQAVSNAAQDQINAAEQKSVTASDEARAKVAADQLELSKALAALAGGQASQTTYDPTSRYTALPAVGQIIEPGQELWSVDGRPVALIPGTLVPWRSFTAGMAGGPDVAALDQALIALGDGAGLSASTEFTAATATAIERLESSQGEPRTGTLPLGSVIFEPTTVRVTTVHPQMGGPVSPGEPVLEVTSTTPIVTVALPVDQSYLVKLGDPVSVTLPDDTTASGTISAVGAVATRTNSSSGPSAGTSGPPSATVDVTVTMPRPPAAASLDAAPVTVNITNASADGALAVPTTALLALAGGGYAVEVVEANDRHRLLAVTTGIFDDQAGMVQVSGAGLEAGQKVVAAA